ncbi:MAG: aldehyde dehydrogenase family protein [Armatimonadota bacterium]
MPTILNPWDGSVVGTVSETTEVDAVSAVERAASEASTLAALPAHRRHGFLARTGERIAGDSETWARLIVAETGKPIRDARVEVERAARLFSFSADAARNRCEGSFPLDGDPRTDDRIGWVRRRPIGVVAAITPFNFPLNLLAHKVAPALAAGCPVVAKPSERTPLTALRLRETLIAAGCPDAAFGVLTPADPGPTVVRLSAHPAVRLVSYTGSDTHGQAIARIAAGKRVVLELGGNAAVAILPDADIDRAAARCAAGAFSFAGQVCISVQRIAVHASVHERFMARFLARVAELGIGDPSLESTDLGPMIHPQAVSRVDAWVREAREDGAQVLIGGRPLSDRLFPPTVLTRTSPGMKICSEEVFGPVAVVESFETVAEILDWMDASRFGLQAGVFTRDIGTVLAFADRLAVGGLIVDDVPTFRSDLLPYGGERDSGFGRESVSATIEACTTEQVVVIRRPDQSTWA